MVNWLNLDGPTIYNVSKRNSAFMQCGCALLNPPASKKLNPAALLLSPLNIKSNRWPFSVRKITFSGCSRCTPLYLFGQNMPPRPLYRQKKKNLLGPPYFPRPCKICLFAFRPGLTAVAGQSLFLSSSVLCGWNDTQ